MEATTKNLKTSTENKTKIVNKRSWRAGVSQHPAVKRALDEKLLGGSLHVGHANDAFEQEADKVADVITGKTDSEVKSTKARQPAATHTADQSSANAPEISGVEQKIQRFCDQCQEELQLKSDEDQEFDSQRQWHSGRRLAEHIAALRGGGKPLANQDFFNTRFGRDFSGVRIHDSVSDHRLAKSMAAKAFTYGRDIVFAEGHYAPHTTAGKRLLAHELTHVVQQGADSAHSNDDSARMVIKAKAYTPQIQAAEDDAAPPPGVAGNQPDDALEEEIVPDVAGNKRTGLVDRRNASAATITWAQINVARFKNRGHRRNLHRQFAASPGLKRGIGRRVDREGYNDPAQRDKWFREVNQNEIRSGLEQRLEKANAGEVPNAEKHVFEVRNSNKKNQYYYDSLDKLSKTFLIPTWGKGNGKRSVQKFFHVDHIVELQLANWPHATDGNALENMELMEGWKNEKSGNIIQNNILNKIKDFIKATDSAYGGTPQEIKENFTLVFESVNGSGGPSVKREDYWQREEIESGDHLQSVVAADPTKIGKAGLVRIFSRPNGGVSRAFSWSGERIKNSLCRLKQMKDVESANG